VEVDGYRTLRSPGPVASNANAAVLLILSDATAVVPAAYFDWSEGTLPAHLARYLLQRPGDTPPVARGILRRARVRRQAGTPRPRWLRRWEEPCRNAILGNMASSWPYVNRWPAHSC
jgi:hypothetical protein